MSQTAYGDGNIQISGNNLVIIDGVVVEDDPIECERCHKTIQYSEWKPKPNRGLCNDCRAKLPIDK